MKSFLEYLRELKENAREVKEDAVLAAGSADGAGIELAASDSASSAKGADIVASADAAPPMTDYSVLGAPSKKKCKNAGFFGKNDFYIPQNVLSGEV